MKLDLERRYKVILGQSEPIHIMLVGVGGTGSALALSLGRLAYHAREKGITVKLAFVDPDRVEAKNAGRQLFSPAEVGQNKAVTMARRLNLALGLDIAAWPQTFSRELAGRWTDYYHSPNSSLIVGAVDNTAGRREIAGYIESCQGRCWWLACGNAAVNGQALIGNLTNRRQWQVDDTLGLLTGLPAPHIQEPGLLEPEEEARPLSCADLMLAEEQSLTVNGQVAAIAAQYVYDFALKRVLRQYVTFFTLEPPITNSRCLTAREAARIRGLAWAGA